MILQQNILAINFYGNENIFFIFYFLFYILYM